MNTIFGAFHIDSRPVELSQLESVRHFFATIHRGNTDVWRRGPVVLGVCANSVTSLPPGWPAISPRPGTELVITAAARLDNREELASRLAVPASTLASISDDALILKAYEKWGPQCPVQLLGDFAFVIWDGPNRRLFCARDHMGIKPLFYAADSRHFVFASDPQAVTAHPEVADDISRLAVARYLGEGDLFDDRLTFFHSVVKLPPATSLILDDKGLSEHRYWTPENAPAMRCRHERDYIEQLEQLLVSAVSVRLSADSPVGSHLSGGIDSSSIAAIAASQLAGSGRQLQTWSWMRKPLTEAEASHPEWELGQRVADIIGANHHYTPLTPGSALQVLNADPLRANDTSDLWYENHVRAEAAENNVHVMLSGWGGDQLISNHGNLRHAQTFWRGRVLSTLRDIREEAALAARPTRRFLGLCYRNIFLPVIPAALNGRLRDARGARHSHLQCANEDFSHWAAGQQRKFDPYLGNCTRSDQLRYLEQYYINSRIDSWAVAGARADMDYRYPLLDKRLVEFAIGLPPQMYRSHGQDRYIYRAASARWLPHDICGAHTKLELKRVAEGYLVARQAARDWLGAGALRDNAYISMERLANEIRSLPSGEEKLQASDVVSLMSVLAAIFVSKL